MPEAASAYTADPNTGSSGKFSQISGSRRSLFLIGGAAVAALAMPALAAGSAGDTPVVALFRQWVAAQRHACTVGITDAECDRRCAAITVVETNLAVAPAQTALDLAAKAWVAMHTLGSGGSWDDPCALDDSDYPVAASASDDIRRLYPQLLQILKTVNA